MRTFGVLSRLFKWHITGRSGCPDVATARLTGSRVGFFVRSIDNPARGLIAKTRQSRRASTLSPCTPAPVVQSSLSVLRGGLIQAWQKRMIRTKRRISFKEQQMLAILACALVSPYYLPDYVPNDPLVSNQWHLNNIQAYQAWDHVRGTVKIANIDSGVSHEDIETEGGWNFYDGNNNTADVFGHGTKTSGLSSSRFDNLVGIAGVGGGSRVVPVRVSAPSGSASASRIASGIRFAADSGCKVANVSFSAYNDTGVISACQYAWGKGMVTVFSSGNQGTQITVNNPYCVVVGATDMGDNRASYSNYGNITVTAPGDGVWTTVSGGFYGGYSGTSMAAPVVCGVLGLVFSANPSLSPQEARVILQNTADDKGDPSYDALYGYGRVNAYRAVLAALDAGNPTDPPGDDEAPSLTIVNPKDGFTVSGNRLVVDMTFSDNVGVTYIQANIPGVQASRENPTSPLKFNLNVRKLPSGPFTLTVKARDAAGNETVKTVSLTKK